MYRRDRPAVEEFRPTEQLYRRYRREELVNGMIVAAALKFPQPGAASGQSVNRSRFSRAKDALWFPDEDTRYDGWGVFQFPVACLPAELVCNDTHRQFTFFPKHVPLTKNYAHSEVWCDTLPRSNSEYVRPTSLVRKELRAIISQNIKVVRKAKMSV
jgi:hypothetical protein